MTNKTCVDCGRALETDLEERCPHCCEERVRKAAKWNKICGAAGAALGVMVKSTIKVFQGQGEEGKKG